MEDNTFYGIIADQLACDPEDLTPNTTFSELGATTEEKLTVLRAIDESEGIFTPEEWVNVETLGELKRKVDGLGAP